MADSASFGMMEGAYFVGRKEILEWINTTLKLSLTKVEQTASGAVAIQLLDMMYPGRVPMSKVNWEAKNDYEFINNYKILQKCFDRIGVDKHIDVDKLVRAKYQDNLEFMQWFKRFWEVRCGESNRVGTYDPVAARSRGRGGSRAASNLSEVAKAPERIKTTGAQGATTTDPAPLMPPPPALHAQAEKQSASMSRLRAPCEINRPPSRPRERPTPSGPAAPVPRNPTPKAAGHGPLGATPKNTQMPSVTPRTADSHRVNAANSPKRSTPNVSPMKSARKGQNSVIDMAMKRENETLCTENSRLQLEASALEKERDFYFDKLVDIEMFLQGVEEGGEEVTKEQILENIFEVLYAHQDGPALVVTATGEFIRGEEAVQYKEELKLLDKTNASAESDSGLKETDTLPSENNETEIISN